jgi:hypothetical protein
MTDSPLPNPFDSAAAADACRLEGLEREFLHPSEPFTFPPNCPPFYPIVHHNIAGEIPPNRILPVRVMFITAISFSFALIFSHFAAWFSGNFESDNHLTSFHMGKELFFSLFYIFLFVPLIFHVQYWPFYCANRDRREPVRVGVIQGFVIGVMFVFFLGLPGTGMVGLVYAFSAFNEGEPVNQALAGILTIWHACNLVVESMLFLLLQTVQRTGGVVTNEETH